MTLINKLRVYIRPFLNWKFLISFGLAWMITNGFWYIGIWVGVTCDIHWLWKVCTVYVGILYLPFTIEKIITIPIAMWLQGVLFKRDLKLRKELNEMNVCAKKDLFRAFKVIFLRLYLKRVDNGKKIKKSLFVIF